MVQLLSVVFHLKKIVGKSPLPAQECDTRRKASRKEFLDALGSKMGHH